MKTRLFLVGAALVLGLGSGCATYSGGTADEDGVVYGSEYVNPHQDYMGARAVPVWKQPSPSGHELGGTRPEIIWYR